MLILAGLSQLAKADPPKLTSAQQVRVELQASLKPGDSDAAIQQFFKQRGLGFSYDRFSNRYQSIIREPNSNFHAVVIYINVDREKRFVSGEARDSYTAP
jgi:hypothetical protein